MAHAPKPVWSPSNDRIERATMTRFIRHISKHWRTNIDGYNALHQFSIDQPEAFWDALWDFLEIIGEKGSDIILDRDALPGARWFPQARINFAENHLRRRDEAAALIGRTESGARRTVSWRELYEAVSRLQQALVAAGFQAGDRVAACLPNTPEAVIGVLGTTSLGGIWSACAPEYGEQALLDRVSTIEPTVLLIADGYTYAGKQFDLRGKAAAIVRSVPSIKQALIVPFVGLPDSTSFSDKAILWDDFVDKYPAADISFPRFGFDHPLYILYSSGTTGKPKAIIHSTGGCLLQSLKDMFLHYDVQYGECTFFHTNTGWMVWNTMLAVLARGAPTVLYDGSPTYPRLDALFDIMADEQVSAVRIVPALIDAYAKGNLHPAKTHDLGNLKSIGVGSAPLLPHHCEYVYGKIKSDVHLLSPAGGTDVFGTLATGNPIGPVYPGEIQVRSLGMKVEVFDQNAKPVIGQAGELVCTRPFPSVPVGFWNDPTGERVIAAYFSHYPGVWRHGDWAEITPRGGVVIHGRADATLNINGIRIGTAEIYRGLESLTEVREAAAVAHQHGGHERMILFVMLADGHRLDDALSERIKNAICARATARHAPAKIIAVADIPRSLNGKPSEVAIRETIHGRAIPTHVGLSNPEALALYRNLSELAY